MSTNGSRRPLRRLTVLAAAGVCLLAIIGTSSAQAAFTIGRCQGSATAGRGASFQNTAQGNWRATFPAFCGGSAAAIAYDGAGSGAGRRAMGEGAGVRDAAVRFAAADEAPTPAQRTQMENGSPADAADDGRVHVIPVAIGAITVNVNLPAGCTIAARPEIPGAVLAAAFAGDASADTWGELVPGITAGSACADVAVRRTVRQDSSGTTAEFKKWLSRYDPRYSSTFAENLTWAAGSAGSLLRPPSAGNGALATLNSTTDGSIGYSDLATSRGRGFNYVAADNAGGNFWLPIQTQATGTYLDPASGDQASATATGSNCESAAVAGAPTDTFGNWSAASTVYSPGEYGICALTYILAWDDNAPVYCNSAAEQAQARTVKDYVDHVTGPTGQATLTPGDYAPTPTALGAIARAGYAAIDWSKTGGRACPVAAPVPVPPASTPPGAGGPAVVTVSNRFTISSARVSRQRRIVIAVRVPGAGTLSVRSTYRAGRRTRSVGNVRLTASRAGTYRLSIRPSRQARSAAARSRSRRLRVTVRVTYNPRGGTPRTITRTVTLRAASRR